MPFIHANGAEFYYELHGQGKPLVLIAGYTCDHTYWLPVLDHLAKQFQVLIFDNRASGQTKDAGEELSAELMAKDVIAICDALGLEKPHIAGQSMGGTIAQTIAALYPDKISHLVILTSTAKWREVLLYACENMLKLRQDNIDLGLLVELMLPWVYSNEFLLNPVNVQMVKSFTLEYPFLLSVENQARQFAFLRQFDGREQLKRITAPTLIIYGVDDIASMPADSKFMANQIRHAKLVKFDCAHGITIEATKQLVEEMHQFLLAESVTLSH